MNSSDAEATSSDLGSEEDRRASSNFERLGMESLSAGSASDIADAGEDAVAAAEFYRMEELLNEQQSGRCSSGQHEDLPVNEEFEDAENSCSSVPPTPRASRPVDAEVDTPLANQRLLASLQVALDSSNVPSLDTLDKSHWIAFVDKFRTYQRRGGARSLTNCFSRDVVRVLPYVLRNSCDICFDAPKATDQLKILAALNALFMPSLPFDALTTLRSVKMKVDATPSQDAVLKYVGNFMKKFADLGCDTLDKKSVNEAFILGLTTVVDFREKVRLRIKLASPSLSNASLTTCVNKTLDEADVYRAAADYVKTRVPEEKPAGASSGSGAQHTAAGASKPKEKPQPKAPSSNSSASSDANVALFPLHELWRSKVRVLYMHETLLSGDHDVWDVTNVTHRHDVEAIETHCGSRQIDCLK